ncbi:IucA/IucC family protein [Photobacterium leiognathi]|uniref:IucA/IucC family protein n=1 Tax=Photobacterium leiognathi TaxID=553611 RepID=UPI002981FABF|nr:IucA/IucC family protein [Photobacterium leiognathi]
MMLTAKKIAEVASFQALFNCYLKECKQDSWYRVDAWMEKNELCCSPSCQWVIEINLPIEHVVIAVEVTYKTIVGRHAFGDIWLKNNDENWYTISEKEAAITLLDSFFEQKTMSLKKQELLIRLLESMSLMEYFLAENMTKNAPPARCFIDAEQSLVFGHWQHPTPKSRQGMLDFHHQYYAPELKGEFALHYFNVARSLICQRSALSISAEEIIASSLETADLQISDEFIVLPMHPLQAQKLLHDPAILDLMTQGLIIDSGQHGCKFTATSSVRSLYSVHLSWMYKFSIPVKITNSLRVNKRHELDAGVVMAGLYRKTGFSSDYPSFNVVTDPAYVTVLLPEQEESGFETIIRENPFQAGQDQDVLTIAALTQDPLPNQASLLASIIVGLATKEHCSESHVAMRWFARYWDCAIDPMIRLYDEHGIALEAHQQNSVIQLESGYPSNYYFRDNQGFYLSKSYRSYLEGMEPESSRVNDLYFDDEMICERFTYYLMINHLFSIIGRLGADHIIDEALLLNFVKQRLTALHKSLLGGGKLFVEQLLTNKQWAMKANLLTRVHDVDELMVENEQAIYCYIDNPFITADTTNQKKEVSGAID